MIKAKKTRKSIIVPQTGISSTKKSIHISCQLQDIAEEKIRIDLDQGQLIISAVNDTNEILKKIAVPVGSYISSKKYHGGTLEIYLERPS